MQTQLTRHLANSALLLVITLTASNAAALEWVDYEGEIPDNAVSVNEGTEDRPICRQDDRIGFVNDNGRCVSMRLGERLTRRRQNFQILVETPAVEVVEVVENIIVRENTYTPTISASQAAAVCKTLSTIEEAFYPSNAPIFVEKARARRDAFLWYVKHNIDLVTGSYEDPLFDDLPPEEFICTVDGFVTPYPCQN